MKVRADVRLVEQGLAESREKARSLIMSGAVFYGEARVEKPGENLPEEAELAVRGNPIPFASRGGLKLEKAIEKYQIILAGLVALDVGASTGGFTDCMLQHGATKVYAIDVGYGQLDWRLRNDARVVVMERTNARNMQPDWFAEPAQFACVDVSFISIKLILPPLAECLTEGAQVVVLVKPQFEAGRGKIGKNGVVRDAGVHEEVLHLAVDYAAAAGLAVRALDFSPITGPKGNIEFLAVLQKGGDSLENIGNIIQNMVKSAHASLNP
jgi:23S rRNA (cytidine1920-2'-O)/16S rRNA (cytidine1409-2'-O)-methyltransferase